MITKSPSFVVGDKTFLKLEDAQVAALTDLLGGNPINVNVTDIVKCREQVVNILTTKGTSHPAARKINRKPKKSTTPPANEPQTT